MALIRQALMEKQKQLENQDNLSRAHDAERRIIHKKLQKFNDHLDVPLMFLQSNKKDLLKKRGVSVIRTHN